MKVKLTSEDEEKIYELYKNGISMKNIADQYGTSFNRISKTINNYCFTHNVPKPISLQERKTKQLPLKTIIERINNGEHMSKLAKEYFVSFSILKKALLNNEEGKKLFCYDAEKCSYFLISAQNRKKEFNLEEIVNAYQNNRLEDFAKENNVSTSTLRNRLRENYGDDYFKKLMKNDNNKKIVQLYENGFSTNQIAKKLRTKCRIYKKRNK